MHGKLAFVTDEGKLTIDFAPICFFYGFVGSTDGATEMPEICVYNRLFMAFLLIASEKNILG